MSPDPLIQFGDPALISGCYLLRIQLPAGLSLAFGRYQQGRSIALPGGDWLYLGSAMNNLPRRLIRHASRSGTRPAQPIRPLLIERYECPAPTSKKLHWHVDYLLDHSDVKLAQILAIYSAVPLEPRLAALLADYTEVVQPGLGASDWPGQTHLRLLGSGERDWLKILEKCKQLMEP